MKLQKVIFSNISGEKEIVSSSEEELRESTIYSCEAVDILESFCSPFSSLKEVKWSKIKGSVFGSNSLYGVGIEEPLTGVELLRYESINEEATKEWSPLIKFEDDILILEAYVGDRRLLISQNENGTYNFECQYDRPSLYAAKEIIGSISFYRDRCKDWWVSHQLGDKTFFIEE